MSVKIFRQLSQAEAIPLITVVPKDRNVSEEYLFCRVIFGGVPDSGSSRVEKLGNYERINLIFLTATFANLSNNSFVKSIMILML